MSDWPIGISTGCFYKSSILDVLELVRDGGFTLIEICSFPKHLDYHDADMIRQAADHIRRTGLEPISFHAPFADHIDITSPDPAQRGSSVQELLTAAAAAAELGVRHLVLHPGPETEGRPPDEEFRERLENAAVAIDQVAARCRELGLTLLLENMLPHLLFGRTQDMLYIMGAIEEANVGTCLDTGHANLAGDIASVVRKLSSHLRMVHANDNCADWDEHLPPGQGGIEWPLVLQQLEGCGFRGALVLELSARHGTDYQATMREARESRQYLQSICRELDRKRE